MHAQSERLGDAVTQLREAIRLSPDNATLHSLLSQALEGTGDLAAAAIAEQKNALRLLSDDADGWNNLGVLEARAGKNTSARSDFLHALHSLPAIRKRGRTSATCRRLKHSCQNRLIFQSQATLAYKKRPARAIWPCCEQSPSVLQ